MAGGRDVRAGGAYVEISANRAALTRGLNAASRELTAFGGMVRNVGAGLAGVGAAITAPLALAVRQFSAFGDGVAKMARRTGLAVETVSALNIQAELSGTSLENMEKATRAMARGIFDAKRGAGEMKDALAEMGLTFEDLDGLEPDKQFWKLADAISSIKDPSIRSAVAMKAFGRAGSELIPLFDAGSESMKETAKRAKELGLILDRDAAASAEVLNDQLTWLEKALRGIQNELGSALARDVSLFAEALVEGAKQVVRLIRENKELIRNVAAVGVAIAAAGTALLGAGVAIQAVGFAAAGLAKALGLVAVMFNPMIIASAAAAAGILFLLDALGIVETGFSKFVQGIKIGGLSIGAWLTLAALEGMKAWEELKTGIAEVFDDLVTGAEVSGKLIAAGLLAGVKSVAVGMEKALKGITGIIATVAQSMVDLASKLKIIGVGEAKAFKAGIRILESGVSSSIGGLAKDVTNGIDSALAVLGEGTEKAVTDRIQRSIDRSKGLQDKLNELNQAGGDVLKDDLNQEDPLANLVDNAKSRLAELQATATGFSDKINKAVDDAYAAARGESDKAGAAAKADGLPGIKGPAGVFGSFSAREVSSKVGDQQVRELNKANGFLKGIADSTKRLATDGLGLA